MYKAVCVAVLLYAMFSLTGSKSADASAAGSLTSPVIVAKVSRTGRTTTIPITTIFTPRVSGLFRIAPYLAVTSPGVGNGAWMLSINYTDEAGAEQIDETFVNNNALPPRAWSPTIVNGGAAPFVFRAIAGSPVSYSVSAAQTSGTYELFLTVERLMY
jgi:hypothetical protein